ncbi:hypothetical protein GOODEAATRI_014881 [Goodea atripinnis]|uniref:Uncharacterized protein n=1 Tax=Goodea atripinnis TaxID=208336 RepID=A0ABV0MS44_9TELE
MFISKHTTFSFNLLTGNGKYSVDEIDTVGLPLHVDLFDLLSLGCYAAAPVSAGGCCTAAKAGTTEVQHGQRSVRRRKCETSDDFLFDLIKYLAGMLGYVREIYIKLPYPTLPACRKSSNAS